jgi:hypothetical protein
MVGVGNIVSVGGFGSSGGGGGGSGIQELNGQIGPVVTLIGTSGIVISPVATNQLNIGFAGSITQSGVLGVNGIDVEQLAGNFVVDGAALSGLITPSGGIGGINGQIGPHLDLKGVNGVNVSVSEENCIVFDAASISGQASTTINGQFAASFTNITSGIFSHNLGSRDVVVQIYDNSAPPVRIIPDSIIYDTLDAVSVLFNTPQTGRIVIVGGVGSGSGITTLNPGENTGPTVNFTGVNGINITGGSNEIVVDGTAVSGSISKFAASFSNITSGIFTHGLNTLDVLVQVRDTDTGGANIIIPDQIIIENLDQVSVLFNRPQNGRVIIV